MPSFSATASAFLIRLMTFGLGIAFFLEQAGARQLLRIDPPDGTPLFTHAYWLGLVAPAFYLWAVWAASNVFIRINKGEPFDSAIVRGMNHIGAGLMLGAWSAILLKPAMLHLIGNGFLEMRGVKLDYTVENLTVAVVGLALVMLAKQGRKLKSTLDQFV
jgi:hypothetical protein